MILTTSKTIFAIEKIMSALKVIFELTKFRLSFLVSFSAIVGFILASDNFIFIDLLVLGLSGYLVTAASVINNQILEKELDKKMDRTKNRPLPTNRITKTNSTIISIIFMVIGLVTMTVYFNFTSGLLSLASLLLYTFVYTPLKKVGPIAVFVGAIPGALPPLIGWVAFSGVISIEAIIIFSIQFIWQFPHFWAIAWIYHDDYKKVGFKLLPSKGEKNFNTALNIMTYTLFLIPLGLLPTVFGITGIISGAIAVFCAILFLAQTFKLFKDYSRSSALKIMFGSFIYLPIVQISFILDKI
ncbi:MAG: protoheme IX farnesyltransferase [Flammeovirgaceae bacterium]|nr:protoheme IX farnesyltransferase [Flammeovirgaceae bacterium]